MDGVTVGPSRPSDVEQALDVLARGMRDNPIHVAILGPDPEHRRRTVRRLFAGSLGVADWYRHALVARDRAGVVVGVCGMLAPGHCRLTAAQQLRGVPNLVRLGPRAALRTMRWLGAWARHDPAPRHWHLGPVAVDAPLQGRGIGSQLLAAFAARMDAERAAAYLETDKPVNVHFYERFGFAVVGEEAVLGAPCWFMLRRAR